MKKHRLAHGVMLFSIMKIFSYHVLWKDALDCFFSIFNNFFTLQFKAVLRKKHIRVSFVDHPLDGRIPFKPEWVRIYMDFSSFWVRIAAFLLDEFDREAIPAVRDMLTSMNAIYKAAAGISRENFSTTVRPRYWRTPSFMLIHIFDPHLMCVPSLHVMVTLCARVKFSKALEALGAAERFKEEREEVRIKTVLIIESILYVKQHSVNCVPAALYTLTSLDKEAFNPAALRAFIEELFLEPDDISLETVRDIKNHIVSLYEQFVSEGVLAKSWQAPLLSFLKEKYEAGG
ncbi:MAG: hypothetical protein LBC77_01750 [Spirochaetaceae bacterium]|jgi:hypothetical protein|nr:hypothetical protein [Spirochaetaceae bacterium]